MNKSYSSYFSTNSDGSVSYLGYDLENCIEKHEELLERYKFSFYYGIDKENLEIPLNRFIKFGKYLPNMRHFAGNNFLLVMTENGEKVIFLVKDSKLIDIFTSCLISQKEKQFYPTQSAIGREVFYRVLDTFLIRDTRKIDNLTFYIPTILLLLDFFNIGFYLPGFSKEANQVCLKTQRRLSEPGWFSDSVSQKEIIEMFAGNQSTLKKKSKIIFCAIEMLESMTDFENIGEEIILFSQYLPSMNKFCEERINEAREIIYKQIDEATKIIYKHISQALEKDLGSTPPKPEKNVFQTLSPEIKQIIKGKMFIKDLIDSQVIGFVNNECISLFNPKKLHQNIIDRLSKLPLSCKQQESWCVGNFIRYKNHILREIDDVVSNDQDLVKSLSSRMKI